MRKFCCKLVVVLSVAFVVAFGASFGSSFACVYVDDFKNEVRFARSDSVETFDADSWFAVLDDLESHDRQEIFLQGVLTGVPDSLTLTVSNGTRWGSLGLAMSDANLVELFDGASVLVRGEIMGDSLSNVVFLKVYG